MTTSIVTKSAISDSEYDAHFNRLFGINFLVRLEPQFFYTARELSADYTSGTWDFFALSNGGFYMSPRCETLFEVSCASGAKAKLSADGFGITVCLVAFSRLSFGGDAFAETCGRHYYLLRKYMFEHFEVSAILRATD